MTRQQLYDDLSQWVRTDTKIEELGNILLSLDAPHKRREYLVGFLHSQDARVEEILRLIDRHNKWTDYKPSVTKQQAHSVVKSAAANRGGDETGPPPEQTPAVTETTETRYVFRRHGVGPFTGSFNEGANGYATYIDTEQEGRVATFREVGGEDHTLLVIDMDADVEGDPSPEDLADVWATACTLYREGDWWLLKFSGRKGFHVIDKLHGEWSGEELEAEARARMQAAGVSFETWADTSMFDPKQPIRCINSEHMASGLHSVVVSPRMSIEQVFEAARNPGEEYRGRVGGRKRDP